MSAMSETIEIPSHLLPKDGRFGSGPSKVSDAQIAALKASGVTGGGALAMAATGFAGGVSSLTQT